MGFGFGSGCGGGTARRSNASSVCFDGRLPFIDDRTGPDGKNDRFRLTLHRSTVFGYYEFPLLEDALYFGESTFSY